MRLARGLWTAPLFLLWLVLVPVSIGQISAAGVATLAEHAQIAGATLTSGTTIFSGDLISTEDQGQVQVQSGRIRLSLEPQSSFRVFKSGEIVVVELERGTLIYSTTPGDALIIYALDSRLVPERATGAKGQVTIVSRCEMRATSQTHTLDVTVGKETKTIEETKTYSVRSAFGIEYRDSWKPVPSDYPDFDPDSAYHRSHSHSACGLAETHPNQAPTAGASSHFAIGAAIIGGVVVCLVLCRSYESPDKPSAH